MKYEVYHADTCVSDYWSGHHLPHVQIPVWRGMTLKEVKDGIKSELAQGAVMGSTEEAFLLSAEWVGAENEKAADKVTRAAYAAVNRMKPAKKGQKRFFLDLDEQGEDDETIYAFFVFVELD